VSLFRRARTEKRSIDSVPWDQGGTLGGKTVTQDKYLGLAPVYAANRHIADQVSTLPLKSYRRLGEKREPTGLPQLLQFLEEDGTVVDWVTRLVLGMTVHGNSIGLITNLDGFGFPTAVNWRPRSEWHVDDENPALPQWYWSGRKIDREQILHIPWLTVPGKTLGLSPLEAAMLTYQAGVGAQEFGNDWFKAGGVPPGTFKNTAKTVDQREASIIKARLVRAIQSREPIVYGSDWDFSAITIPPEQAQFVESQKLTANQIAAIYGIDPEEVGGEPANSLTYNNEEHRQTKRLANLRPWLVRIETGLSARLPERRYVKFNTAGAVRSDLKSRHEVYRIDREIGLMSVDEIRALEDLPPLPEGQGGKEYTPLQQQQPKRAPEAE
jgi:HK97 family phage portal protein